MSKRVAGGVSKEKDCSDHGVVPISGSVKARILLGS